MKSKIIRPKELKNRLCIAISTLYEWIKRPDFPQKIQLGKNAVGYFEHEINEWLENQKVSKA